MHDAQTFYTAGKSCPSNWQTSQNPPKTSIFNFDYALHPEAEQLCQLKFLSVCTIPLFDQTLHTKCKQIELAATYKTLVDELGRIAVAGEGDRTCNYHVSLMPCYEMDFSEISDADKFVAKFNVLLNNIYAKCGKNALQAQLNQKMTSLLNILNEQCEPIVETTTKMTTTTVNSTTTSSKVYITTTSSTSFKSTESIKTSTTDHTTKTTKTTTIKGATTTTPKVYITTTSTTKTSATVYTTKTTKLTTTKMSTTTTTPNVYMKITSSKTTESTEKVTSV